MGIGPRLSLVPAQGVQGRLVFWMVPYPGSGIRTWVIQEFALARKAWLHCGNDIVTWDDFADAIRFVRR
jgi:hypothetical protein